MANDREELARYIEVLRYARAFNHDVVRSQYAAIFNSDSIASRLAAEPKRL